MSGNNSGRALEKLKLVLKDVGMEGVRFIEEKLDEQYKALEHLKENVRGDLFLKLVVANALVSFQLSGKGEDYWWEFSRWFSRKENYDGNVVSSFERFLKECRYNRRFLSLKLRRLKKAERFLNDLDDRFYQDMGLFVEKLSKELNTKKEKKTIVFSLKMYGYASRIKTKLFLPFPFSVSIPLDVRIREVTKKLGVKEKEMSSFWFEISKEIGIPPLHLDSFLWVLKNEEKRKMFLEKYKIKGLEELFYYLYD